MSATPLSMNILDLVAVPYHDWKKSQSEGFRTRDVHLLQEFRRHPAVHRLLILDRPTSIAEMLLLRRPWHISGGECVYKRAHRCLTQLDDKTFVLDLFTLQTIRPIAKRRRWIPESYGHDLTYRAVLEAISYLKLSGFVLFLSSPLPIPLYRRLGCSNLVVDAIDNLIKIPQYANMRAEIADYYKEIRQCAAVIFSNSVETAKWLSTKERSGIHIPNGVDFLQFRAKGKGWPDDLQKIRPPIVGYAGKMQEIFDVDMLRSSALALPEVSFVCIGQLLNPRWLKPLWRLPNVYYLGDKHYDFLPDYLAHFDVCTIPYSVERQHSNDPIKFYEYLAMGKPVVTTRIGGVETFGHLAQVKIVTSTGEYIAAIRYYLNLIQKGERIPPFNLPSEVLWSTKANKMIQAILQKIPDLTNA